MTNDIAALLRPYLETLAFADKVAGLVRTVTVSDQDTEGRSIKKVFPISCDVTHNDCIKGKFKDLIPNSKYKSIMYFEETSPARLITEDKRDFTFTSSLKLVGWLNSAKLGKTNCSISGLAVAHVLKVLPIGYLNSGIYQRIHINTVSQDIKSNAIFSKYSYNEEKIQYLMFPYDYFALNITVSFTVAKACIGTWEEGIESLCVNHEQQ